MVKLDKVIRALLAKNDHFTQINSDAKEQSISKVMLNGTSTVNLCYFDASTNTVYFSLLSTSKDVDPIAEALPGWHLFLTYHCPQIAPNQSIKEYIADHHRQGRKVRAAGMITTYND